MGVSDIPVTRVSDVLNGGRLYLILLTSPLAHMFIAVVTAMVLLDASVAVLDTWQTVIAVQELGALWEVARL